MRVFPGCVNHSLWKFSLLAVVILLPAGVTALEEKLGLELEWTFNTSDQFPGRQFGVGHQGAITIYDIDGDGRDEFIATKASPDAQLGNWYSGLSSDLCWIKPVNPLNGQWEVYPIGTGDGDWPHGTLVGSFLSGGKLALVVGYHSAEERGDLPQIFEVPDDPKSYPWSKRVLAEIPYGGAKGGVNKPSEA